MRKGLILANFILYIFLFYMNLFYVCVCVCMCVCMHVCIRYGQVRPFSTDWQLPSFITGLIQHLDLIAQLLSNKWMSATISDVNKCLFSFLQKVSQLFSDTNDKEGKRIFFIDVQIHILVESNWKIHKNSRNVQIHQKKMHFIL